jgi:succinyl-CoA synthetase beta subunit
MPALSEYRTRELLQSFDVPVVDGLFIPTGSPVPDILPAPPVYLKAQIPGATSRAEQGLVRKAVTSEEVERGLTELLSSDSNVQSDGVLLTNALDIVQEHYAACLLDFGSAGHSPSGVLIWSPFGGSGVEDRADSLMRFPFSLLHPPTLQAITEFLPEQGCRLSLARLFHSLIAAFCRFRLMVLETNPVAVLEDDSVVVVDCRAEFEKRAVAKTDAELFEQADSSECELSPLESAVEEINRADPSGTGFFRQNREVPSAEAISVATNLCGGGGKMLWEMATGCRTDIFTMNESDTSGGLSAFKSYRILRAILAQKGAQALLLTGSGMAFQNQHHIAAAVWKALRESATPLPCLLRFGGTDQDKARDLMESVAPSLPVDVRVYSAEIFPNAMVDDLAGIAQKNPIRAEPEKKPEGEPLFSVDIPPGDFYFYPDLHTGDGAPGCLEVCPTGHLAWNAEQRTVERVPDTRCTGCLMCETASILEGNGELRIHLDVPPEVV